MEIDELEQKLKEIEKKPVWLGCAYINNPDAFIEGHLKIIKNNGKEGVFHPYYQRLVEYYEKMKDGQD